MKTAVTLLTLFALCPWSSFAQDYTQWRLPEGAKARLGKGHITGNIAYSPDGTRFAMASSIGIWIYDAHAGKELALLTGHTGEVSGVSFSPDGATLATGSLDYTVRLWDMNTGTLLRTLTGHTGGVETVAFSPDNSTLSIVLSSFSSQPIYFFASVSHGGSVSPGKGRHGSTVLKPYHSNQYLFEENYSFSEVNPSRLQLTIEDLPLSVKPMNP